MSAHSLPTIAVESLNFTYPGVDHPTLRELTFSLRTGEIYGFLGPSGAGKSTTQKILYGLLAGFSGIVRIDGREIGSWGHELYRRTGIAFETPNLYLKLTGRENLEFAMALHAAAGKKGEKSDRGVGDIDSAAARLGLAEAIDTRVESWSKGMRTRLSFIRAVLHAPTILFLDEPTSGLDPRWARTLKDWIAELRDGGCAVFLTTHSMELADELCDTVGFLVDGSLIAEGAPASLKQQHGRPGITVSGLDHNGEEQNINLDYEQLPGHTIDGFSKVTRVVNREVSLEHVFLAVTGRSLKEG